MRKRAHALFLSACLALSLMVPAQAANTELAINAPDELPDVGETFTVTVDISDNPGLAAVKLTLGFDESVVDCVDVISGSVLKGALAATNPDAKDGAIIAAASAQDKTGDGTLVTFEFEVVGEGNPDIEVSEYVLSNSKGEEIDFDFNVDVDVKPGNKPVVEEEEENKTSAVTTPTKEGRFTDTGGHPSESYIYEAVDRGFFQGYADGSFKPNGNVTRGAFVTVLWRMAGRPEPTNTTPFTDIGNVSAEFQKAIAWAYGKGYINGRTATTFAPGDAMSRQATMKILFHHYGGGSGEELMYYGIYDSYFTDGATLNEQFKAPMYWGIYNGLIEGKTETTLGGPTVADRALLATTLVKYTDRFGN